MKERDSDSNIATLPRSLLPGEQRKRVVAGERSKVMNVFYKMEEMTACLHPGGNDVTAGGKMI